MGRSPDWLASEVPPPPNTPPPNAPSSNTPSSNTPPNSPEARLQQLQHTGAVIPVHIRPLEWGGVDAAPNMTWLPPAAATDKAAFERKVERHLTPNMAFHYGCSIEFDETDPLVASRLVLEAVGDDFVLSCEIDVKQYKSW